MTDKQDFLSLGKALVESAELELPELEMTVVLKGLTGREMRAITLESRKPTPKGRKGKADEVEIDDEKMTSLMVGRSVFAQDGARLIPEGRESELYDLPFSIVNKLTTEVQRLNGWGLDADDAKNP